MPRKHELKSAFRSLAKPQNWGILKNKHTIQHSIKLPKQWFFASIKVKTHSIVWIITTLNHITVTLYNSCNPKWYAHHLNITQWVKISSNFQLHFFICVWFWLNYLRCLHKYTWHLWLLLSLFCHMSHFLLYTSDKTEVTLHHLLPHQVLVITWHDKDDRRWVAVEAWTQFNLLN
jgi:hypothetical protein